MIESELNSGQDVIKKQRRNGLLLITGIIIFGANLRAPITTVGPVVPEIIEKLRLTPVSVSLITTIPLLCFSFFSTFMPRFSNRIGIDRFLVYSLLLLAVGIFIRSSGSVFFLFAGSAVVGVAITAGNVMMPAFIKKRFSQKAGLVTGFYLISMNIASATAVGYSIALGGIAGLGWKSSIGIWGVPALLTFIGWLFYLKGKNHQNGTGLNKAALRVWKSRLAWQISIFMGLQSVVFYVFAAFMPAMLQDWGMGAVKAGWMLSLVQVGQIPTMLVGALIAARLRNLTPVIWFTFLALLAGLVLIAVFKTRFTAIASLLVGVGVGMAFALATMFFILRTRTIGESAALSGMAQSIGYLEAAIAPPIFGAIFELTGSWVIPMFLLFVSAVILLLTGLPSAKGKFV